MTVTTDYMNECWRDKPGYISICGKLSGEAWNGEPRQAWGNEKLHQHICDYHSTKFNKLCWRREQRKQTSCANDLARRAQNCAMLSLMLQVRYWNSVVASGIVIE